MTPLATEFHYNFHKPIGNMEEYEDLTQVLDMMGPNDVLYLHFNTPGGSLNTAVDLIQRIAACQGTVVGCADGEVASAGSLLFFACEAWEVGDYCEVMLHDGSGGVLGRISENASSIESTRKRIAKLYNKVYGPFFKKKEIKSVLSGADIYLDADGVIKRLQKYVDSKPQETIDLGELLDSTDSDA